MPDRDSNPLKKNAVFQIRQRRFVCGFTLGEKVNLSTSRPINPFLLQVHLVCAQSGNTGTVQHEMENGEILTKKEFYRMSANSAYFSGLKLL